MHKRVIVVGAVLFGRRCLDALARADANIAGVITGNERTLRRHSDACSLVPAAERLGVPYLETEDINAPNVLAWMRSLAPDVLLVVGWSQLCSRTVLNLPAIGCIGAHPTILPEGRGRHPIIWTLLRGLDRGGLSFFMFGDGADTGDIILQEAFDITDDDDAGSVYEKVCRLGESAMPALAKEIERGCPNRRPQDESRATYYPKRSSRDGEIDWTASARQIRILVRALAPPYPGAHTFVQREGRLVRMVITRCVEAPAAAVAAGPPAAGTVSEAPDGVFIVQTGQGAIVIQACRPPDLLRTGDVLCRETAGALL